MRFVLTYTGLLPSSADNGVKHKIRKAIHPQLARQWQIEDSLISIASPNETGVIGPPVRGLENIAAQFARGNFRFAPLVTRSLDLVCYLEITMLRREEPGNLIRFGGDIDNRVKALFDSLRVPDVAQVASLTPTAKENPFFCLLEDDSLVTGYQVKTERLLEPPSGPESQWDVQLMMTAIVRPTKVTIANLSFLGGWL